MTSLPFPESLNGGHVCPDNTLPFKDGRSRQRTPKRLPPQLIRGRIPLTPCLQSAAACVHKKSTYINMYMLACRLGIFKAVCMLLAFRTQPIKFKIMTLNFCTRHLFLEVIEWTHFQLDHFPAICTNKVVVMRMLEITL